MLSMECVCVCVCARACICPRGSQLFTSQLCGPGGVFVILHVEPARQHLAGTKRCHTKKQHCQPLSGGTY